eukprot:2236263-Amphidinium_carterae.1
MAHSCRSSRRLSKDMLRLQPHKRSRPKQLVNASENRGAGVQDIHYQSLINVHNVVQDVLEAHLMICPQ